MKKITFSFLLLLCSMIINGQVFVKPASDGGNDANDGSSWDNAKATVAAAISVAKAASNKNIFVKQGTYNETWGTSHNNNTIAGVGIYGSFAGTESAIDQRAKVQDGQPWKYATPSIITFNSSAGIGFNNTISAGNTVIIDGFSFQDMTIESGANISFRDNVTVQNCIFQNNALPRSKHLINPFVTGTAGPGKVLNCYFYNNTTENANIIQCNIGTNSSALVEGCLFANNVSSHRIINGANATKISNCILYNNQTNIEAVLDINHGNGEAVNCLVFNNTCHSAVKVGGTAVNLTVANNKIVTNYAVSLSATTSKVYNTVVVGNQYQDTENGFGYTKDPVTAEIKNCAFDGDQLAEIITTDNNKTLTNLSEVLFVLPSDFVGRDQEKEAVLSNTNWKTQQNSPLIDAGKNTFYTESFHGVEMIDLAGENRINNTIIDMGAYEYDPSIGVAEQKPSLPSLFTTNGQVIINTESPLSVEIFSISGAKVASSQTATYHAIALKEGSYIVVAKGDGNQTVNKIIIQ